MNLFLKSLIVVSLLTGCASAQVAPPRSQPLSPKSTVDDILDALDARGDELKDFSGKVTLTTTDSVTGNEDQLVGKIWMQRLAGDDARLRVMFDRKVINDKPREEKVEYLLDKGMLIDRDYQNRREVQRQVLKPGQKMDLLKLGEGPFPLPLGQDKKDVHEMFEVKKIDAAKDDPPATVHMQLTPRPSTQFERKFKTIDFWVDPETRMPVKIVTEDPNATTTRTTTLTELKVNADLGEKDFALEKINDAEWERVQTEYED
jgi:outer membrane lipoprotein-sorting protein